MTRDDFLRDAGWEGAQAAPLAGDASSRRYTRLGREGETAILMEDPSGDCARFARIARYLRDAGLSAPAILAETPDLMLLEDLGDDLVARIATPDTEAALYMASADAVAALHGAEPLSGLPVAHAQELGELPGITFETYVHDPAMRTEAIATLTDRLAALDGMTEVTILRDFHAENICWLPDREGAARAGLLDFQDAMLGHRAYDLVSLLQDARRDVSADTAACTRRHFLDRTGLDAEPFDRAYALLGAQRNLRILGVFARLSRSYGKPRYLDLVPRVWGHLQANLAHPDLAGLRRILSDLPPPSGAHLATLRPECPTP
ncbi:aminoglycoside phosphotransferase family protein [Allosediminivita pacifica]|uniref:Aminoglycoside phosphotransferase domain-containing protein n=1 Tax=Allosediminivita pacifica TaxID=1267769 RepID=A0A2T6AR79_9RHOB|nr:phosphotransferase [Allosediminivita pacifica]PTX46307.1 hypothetical protein C8N44_11791 [Allosediminivita pacifica]GGB18050.1 aminoglycoside phosphotransferase [Allosediminivita pacifica]